jgi:signal transduction histidine kinase
MDGLAIVVEDDGAGVEAGAPPAGGSGQGLALHSTLMAVVGGTLAAEPTAGGGMRVTLRLPAADG